MSESEIIEKIKNDDHKIYNYLHEKYWRMVYNLVIKKGGTREDSQDVFQVSVMILRHKLKDKNFVLNCAVGTFLYSVALNKWSELYRAHSRCSKADLPERGEHSKYFGDENSVILNEIFSKLSKSKIALLKAYYYDELSMNDIAKKYNYKNSDTVKTQKYKILQKLSELVKKKYSRDDFYYE